MEKLKAVVVDDTIVYRKIVGDILKEIPEIEVAGVANNGKIALSKINSLKPDFITLDIEMPEMSGIEVLEKLRDNPDPPAVIMVSTLTQDSSEMTIKALELGAFDFISKPGEGTMAENLAKVKQSLTPIVETLKRQKRTRARIKAPLGKKTSPPVKQPAARTAAPRVVHKRARTRNSEIVGIGISTGGPNALTEMVPMLDAGLKAPVLIVQHMPPLFTRSLANSLNQKSALEVKEAENGEVIRPGTVYIAPGGKQMKIVAGADGMTRKIKVTDDPPENSCKPSVDYLFRSIAEHYVGRATGVIMTGMGSDGSKGLIQMKKNGSYIIAQDESTCTVYGMPKEPIETGIADVVAPLGKIAEEITKTVIV
ncbi:MAG: protein-glutamate methylesterase/protein-glutamine glutaminase [Thermodesulfobacteriota bacterium]